MSKRYTLSNREKIIILSLMGLLFLTLALVVTQSAAHRNVQLKIAHIDREIAATQEQRRLYQARLAESAMVQQFLLLAEEQGVELSDIPIADANIVLVGDLP